MSKEILLADLRNKLTPVKNYFAIKREIDHLELHNNETIGDEMRIDRLKEILHKEQLICEPSFAQIEYIIELLEKL